MSNWTAQQVLDYFSSPTHYERTNGILTKAPWQLIIDYGEIRFYSSLKSDGTKTLLMLLKHKQGWYGCIPTKRQAEILGDGTFRKIYLDIENFNHKGGGMK